MTASFVIYKIHKLMELLLKNSLINVLNYTDDLHCKIIILCCFIFLMEKCKYLSCVFH